ncbi:hypothetical protein THIOM_003830 [Candidatus Thiomargarita nelsonii]|uniref:Uncharacterized protein n=1 Tax=Candidatus Thiomargarita nelsonii TaxID=1003181 RepID=A0A176RXL3_9GAMM|nr:hypothetical protein THIOM_003830 [Candidatus Thiomargarita nelsonii]
MGDATRQNKQMPDTMEMTHPLIQYVKNYANGIKYSAQQEPGEARQRQCSQQGVERYQDEPAHN